MKECNERKNFNDGCVWTYFVRINGNWSNRFRATNDKEMAEYEGMLIENRKSDHVEDWIAIQRPFKDLTEHQTWEEQICKQFNDANVYQDSIYDDFCDDIWW